MALNKNDMSAAIQAKMLELSANPTANEAQSKFAEAISNYVTANMEVTLSWTAAMAVAPFTVDPVTSLEAEISFASFSLTPPGSGGIADWTTEIYNQVLGGSLSPVKNAVSSPLDYFVFPGQGLGPVVWTPLVQSGITSYPDGLTDVCEQIITKIKSMIQPLPFLPASHIVGPTTFVATACQMITIA